MHNQHDKTIKLRKIYFQVLSNLQNTFKIVSINTYRTYRGHRVYTLDNIPIMNKLTKNSLDSSSSKIKGQDRNVYNLNTHITIPHIW